MNRIRPPAPRSRRVFLARAVALPAACCLTGLVGRPGRAEDRPQQPGEPLAIDADFPGGNIVLERVEGDQIFLHQDPRDTPEFWFYWCFRVRGAAGRKLTFHFTRGNVLGVLGPAVSADGGKNWAWLGAESMRGASFAYAFPPDAPEVRFCLAMPYLEANLREFLHRHAGDPHLRTETLAVTKKGRTIERLRTGKLDGPPAYRVLLTCRHHACEMMASWALEGVLEETLCDTPDGAWLRKNVEILAIPFVDKDGVEDGDQGKNRRPHDPNRDYLGESIYTSVAAIRQYVPSWSEGRLRIALDLHCPYIRGGGDGPSSNQRVFFVGTPSAECWSRTLDFCSVLQQTRQGPLPYDPKNNLPFGQAWNTVAEPRTFAGWAARLPGVLVASSVEIPYADAGGQAVTPDSARALGRDLARAMRRYLEERGGG